LRFGLEWERKELVFLGPRRLGEKALRKGKRKERVGEACPQNQKKKTKKKTPTNTPQNPKTKNTTQKMRGGKNQPTFKLTSLRP